jgi:predicted dehydrogenase
MGGLKVGFIGAGFVAKFHARAFSMVKNAEIVAVYSRTEKSAKELASYIEQLGFRKPRIYTDLHDFLRDREIEAVWIMVPNNLHLEVTKAIVEEVTQGRSNIVGVAIEKPLARNVAEAEKMVQLVEKAGLLHGYLENQVFMPSVSRGKDVVWNIGAKYSGRPYLARAAEEHSGPHNAWFWVPSISGGGVLLDMMCHSIEAARYFLLKPGVDKSTLKPKYVYGEIGFLKWIKKQYVEDLKKRFGIDFLKEPAEDYAFSMITYEDEEASRTTSEPSSSSYGMIEKA